MKILFKLFFIFCFLISSVKAQNILVFPSDLLQTKENYYSFEEPSEIIANDIIREFNKTNGKLKSYDLYDIKAKFYNNIILKIDTLVMYLFTPIIFNISYVVNSIAQESKIAMHLI